MEIDKDLWLTPKHTARETLKILPILDNGYHEIPSSVSEGEAFVPSWLLLFLPGSSFPQLSPPPSPLVTVSLFFVSMSLVLFCLLVCFVD